MIEWTRVEHAETNRLRRACNIAHAHSIIGLRLGVLVVVLAGLRGRPGGQGRHGRQAGDEGDIFQISDDQIKFNTHTDSAAY